MRQRDQAAVVFDLDGVLVDSRAAIASSINHALAAHALPVRPAKDLERFIGPRLAMAFAELTAQPADSALVASCVSACREHYAAASLRDTTVVPGIAEALRDLAVTRRLAVATSNPLAFAEPILRALELREFFDAVAGPDLTAHGEDKAATIAAALRLVGTRRAVMIGDRSFDVVGARAHGLPAIGVTWGIGSADELVAAGADTIVESPADLAAAADRLLGAPARRSGWQEARDTGR